MKSGRRILVALAAGTVLTLMGLGVRAFLFSVDPLASDPWALKVLAPIPLRFGKDWPPAFAWAANVVAWGLVVYFLPTAWSFLKALATNSLKTKQHRVLATVVAVILSFGLYFVRLGRPWTGEATWYAYFAETIRWRQVLPMSLLLAVWGFALFIQIVAFVLIRWILVRLRSWRLLGLLPFVLFLKFAAPALVLEQIPLFFLTAKDKAPARELPLHCELKGSFSAFLGHPIDVSLEEPWLSSNGLLQASLCRVVQFDLHESLSGEAFAVGGGKVVFWRGISTAGQSEAWWYYGGPGSSPRLTESPRDLRDHALSSDGRWIAWFDRQGEGRGPWNRLILESTVREQKESFPFSDLPGWGSILSLDMQNNRLIYGVHRHASDERTQLPLEYYEYGLDGRRHWGPFKPADVGWAGKLRLIRRKGWLAWNQGPPKDLIQAQRIVWSLEAKHGSLEAHKGRTFNSVDVDTEGRFVAVGEESEFIFGRVPGTVFVFDVQTNREIFRRYLPQSSRPVVRFAGPGFFAYSVERPAKIAVFRLPR